MKVIDEKGKLFGKLNIIDLLAILVLVAALAFGGYKLVSRSGGNGDAVSTSTGNAHLTYTARVTGVASDIYDEVVRQMEQNGGQDQLMANGTMVEGAYITKVEAVPHVNYFNDTQGRVVISQDTGADARYDLTFTVEVQSVDPVTSLVGTQEVRVGKSHIVKTIHLEFNSTVVSCNWN